MIKSLKLKNFQLIKEATVDFQKQNVITGINLDDVAQSSNGSGKTTILNAISFALYGKVEGINIADLVHIGEKSTSVELTFVSDPHEITIVRKIPTELQVFVDEIEKQANTVKIKQDYINGLIGDYDSFKKFRCIDNNKGINILDLGIVSLRKTLMGFIDEIFSGVRKSLQNKKLERETYNKDKRLYTFHLSEKRLAALETRLKLLLQETGNINAEKDEIVKLLNKAHSDVSTRDNIIYKITKELKKLDYSDQCPTCLTALTEEKKQHVKSIKGQEVDKLEAEKNKIEETVAEQEDIIESYNVLQRKTIDKQHKTKELIMKLKESFKFADYKFTKQDVVLYQEAIKVLDQFAGYYLNDWLNNLSLIINDLLRHVSMEVTFSAEKQFMTIKNGNNTLKYEQLSSGQKKFLASIFKLAILLQKGDVEGIVLCDEGLGDMDMVNLRKFIDICKTLPYQVFIIYQNIEEVQGINLISLKRKNNVSMLDK